MQILKIINLDNVTEEIANKFKPRLAARGVVFNADNNVAIIPVSKHNYHKLPGGGFEKNETEVEAFRRECLEEIGFDVEVVSELGLIVEYRAQFSTIQTSYCYIGKIVGEKKETALTEHEISRGFKEPIWVPLKEALEIVSTSNPNNYAGAFIKERDTLILETAQKFIK
jgi:8-oxo-dGTP pyrophosphatase MutT (NUDIX family)